MTRDTKGQGSKLHDGKYTRGGKLTRGKVLVFPFLPQAFHLGDPLYVVTFWSVVLTLLMPVSGPPTQLSKDNGIRQGCPCPRAASSHVLCFAMLANSKATQQKEPKSQIPTLLCCHSKKKRGNAFLEHLQERRGSPSFISSNHRSHPLKGVAVSIF